MLDGRPMLELRLCFSRLDAKSLARLVMAYPGSHGIQNFGEAREAERAVVSGMDRQERLDPCATFFATYPVHDCCGI